MTAFTKEMEHLINKHSRENGSDTPDFILAQFLSGCLAAFDEATTGREAWYSRATTESGADESAEERVTDAR